MEWVGGSSEEDAETKALFNPQCTSRAERRGRHQSERERESSIYVYRNIEEVRLPRGRKK